MKQNKQRTLCLRTTNQQKHALCKQEYISYISIICLQNRFTQSEISVIDHTASRLQGALSSECDRRVQAAVCTRSGNGCKLML